MRRHPEFLRLVTIENIHRAAHIAKSSVFTSVNTRAFDLIAFCVFRVANKHAIMASDPSRRGDDGQFCCGHA
jgi:hypothetical protein